MIIKSSNRVIAVEYKSTPTRVLTNSMIQEFVVIVGQHNFFVRLLAL